MNDCQLSLIAYFMRQPEEGGAKGEEGCSFPGPSVSTKGGREPPSVPTQLIGAFRCGVLCGQLAKLLHFIAGGEDVLSVQYSFTLQVRQCSVEQQLQASALLS